jgi:Tfp pilus assembly protein PilP
MKKITLFLTLAFCLALVGCSKDAEVNAFLTEYEAVSNEMVKKINEGDVDGAKAAFDAKKESLRTKFVAFKDARGFQVSQDTQKKMTDSITKNATALQTAITTNAMKLAGDPAKAAKLQALLKDYLEVFKM